MSLGIFQIPLIFIRKLKSRIKFKLKYEKREKREKKTSPTLEALRQGTKTTWTSNTSKPPSPSWRKKKSGPKTAPTVNATTECLIQKTLLVIGINFCRYKLSRG